MSEHGTLRSYIYGFVLSLVFTVIPYTLVVNEIVTGKVLLAAILAIAVLQMIIQVVFFLHLGRERKPRWQLYFFGGTVFGIITVVVGSIFIMSHLHKNMSPDVASKNLAENEGIAQLGGEKTGACEGDYKLHKVIISDGNVNPVRTDASYCDRLVIVNEDDVVREITFGTHPEHGAYAGKDEIIVRKGRAKTVILNQSGSYQFHDHLSPLTAGYFTVKDKPAEQ